MTIRTYLSCGYTKTRKYHNTNNYSSIGAVTVYFGFWRWDEIIAEAMDAIRCLSVCILNINRSGLNRSVPCKELRRSTCYIMVTNRYSNDQTATKSLPGPTAREHRELIGVKTMSLLVRTAASTVFLECCQHFRIFFGFRFFVFSVFTLNMV